MSYKNTFIKVAEDCPVGQSEIPVSKRKPPPTHILQYELLTKFPYKLDHEALVFEVYLKKNGLSKNNSEKENIRKQLFSKGRPCMRTSALTKRYGFGVHYNNEGKIALYSMESAEYRAFIKNDFIEKRPAMKRKR